MIERGFTLIELLVAMIVVVATAGVIAGLVGPTRHAFDRSAGTGEITAAGRAGLSALVADIRDAGSGVVIGTPLRDIGDLIPVIVPWRSLDDRRSVAPFSALTVVRAPGAQAALRDGVVEGDTSIRLDAAAPCPGQDHGCGFAAGDAAVVFDADRAESVVIDAVTAGAGTLTVSRPLGVAFEAGSVIAALEHTTYGLRAGRDGTTRLVRITAGGAEQPVVDHVIDLEIGTDSNPDLIRVRRVDLRLRVEAASDALRGPAGPFFRRSGTATHGASWIRDIELQVAVALRR
jgi:prepilin-type N-terminal cleavage/methylation domain-containing protein